MMRLEIILNSDNTLCLATSMILDDFGHGLPKLCPHFAEHVSIVIKPCYPSTHFAGCFIEIASSCMMTILYCPASVTPYNKPPTTIIHDQSVSSWLLAPISLLL